MKTDYSYLGENIRLSLDNILLNVADREVVIEVRKINKDTYDIESYTFRLDPSSIQGLLTVPGDAAQNPVRHLLNLAAGWLITSGTIDDMIDQDRDETYVRPTLTQVA